MTKKLVTEFVGTFFLVLIIGLVTTQQIPDAPLIIGLGLATMCYMGGSISGAHFNPAVTMAFVMRGALPARESGGYVAVQLAGAVVASLLVRFLTGDSFAPMPGPTATPLAALVVEIVFTFALALVILNVAVAKRAAGNGYYGIAIGLTVAVGAGAGGGISGGAFNPAVGIGPTLVHALLGGGSFGALWLYLAGPLLGAALAAVVFGIQES
jgi:aquaporin Z